MTENDTCCCYDHDRFINVEQDVAELKHAIYGLREVLDATIEGFKALKRLVDFDAKQAGGP